jgi:hypothetical protein
VNSTETRAEYLERINGTKLAPPSPAAPAMSKVSTAWTKFRSLKGWQQGVIVLGLLAAVGSVLPDETPKEAPAASKSGGSAATPAPAEVTTTSFDAYTDSVTPAGVSCEELAGMWESASRSYDNATSGLFQSSKKAGGAIGQAAKYEAAWDSYCSQHGSIVANAH